MWAGQRVLCLLQNLFKQSKLSLTLTLARGKCWSSCSDYNWDPWVPRIALHASRNVPWRLKRLETVQATENSVVVNGCKNSSNNYYWSQVTTLLIRRSMNLPYILYGTPSKFYPSPRTWRHYASWSLQNEFHLQPNSCFARNLRWTRGVTLNPGKRRWDNAWTWDCNWDELFGVKSTSNFYSEI